MKTIPLTQGKVAVVDDCDYDYLMQWKWQYHIEGYASHSVRRGKTVGSVLMHRLIVPGFPYVDHLDGDKLNNTRGNLRAATAAQNKYNEGPSKASTSGLKGVGWSKAARKWTAKISAQTDQGKKHFWLGTFTCKYEAARVWNKAALELHGEFAYQNIIQEPQPVG